MGVIGNMSISQDEHRQRRDALLEAIGPDAALIIPAASEVTRNRDTQYPFRQSSDFLWLTGFPEPEAIAVLAPEHKDGDYVLFVRPKDPERETWDGRRFGPEGAVKDFCAKAAHPLAEIDKKLPKLLASRRQLYYPLGQDDAFDLRVMRWLRTLRGQARKGVTAPVELVDSGELLHEARLRKSESELSMMRKAARISAGAHLALMTHCRPGMSEQQLEALFLHRCAEQGAREQAYPPIVAGGENACILHYVENSARLRDGDLVLIDAGCEWQGYASDITRTFPVNGHFSPAQRELYNLVLEAQQAAIDKARPGQAWSAMHKAALQVLTKGLVRLGLLDKKGQKVRKLIKKEKFKPFYMHRTGHWLGLDVHDVGDYKRDGSWRTLEPGMTLTIEPGLYVAPAAEVPKAYRGIGIRIEDDILITDSGAEILSRDAPKDPDEIERLMAELPITKNGAHDITA
ncbi:Xaa-Pro aminopeptidase [Thiorhodovibrio frisius]|uniref:Xaa-Pro aminopeptidase n=1 Tax=Thiorhodovibrio frisius TaxID=631362 RepID=H8YZ04_9GAMM|nr:Xaa-Pro aminopeptidase [Thiorhodovibrio frisius]WPL24220.1 Xaa-Pro aminopeptidase [Thiorhodovibrio frisius]